MSLRLVRAAATVVACAVFVSGCAELRPGVAAKVDDKTISLDEIDRTATLLCDALEPQLEEAGQVFPMSALRGGVVEQLVARIIGEQLAEEYSVEPDTGYDELLRTRREEASAYPERTRESYIEVTTAGPYLTAVLSEVALAELRAEGVSSPSDEQTAERISELLQAWSEEHVVEFDPRFGRAISDGDFAPRDTALSFPLSDTAEVAALEVTAGPDEAAQAQERINAYAAELPASQRCG